MMNEEKNQLQTNATDSQAESTSQQNETNQLQTNATDSQAESTSQQNETTPVTENNEASELSPEPLASLKSEWKKVDLEPTLTLAQLNELHQQLSQYHDCRVQLCGAKVERVDTAALQLLLAFRNSPDVTVGWIEPSTELCYAAHLLGLSSHLGLPASEPKP
jgi:phospholipid transport system transporter-binding protein